MVYLPHDISSICKMFAYDTSLSSLSLSDLNYELETINQWAHQRKMSLNSGPNKQATEVLFSDKRNSDDHHKLTFNGNQVQQCSLQKHLRLFLDSKLDFYKQFDKKINKCNKIIGMVKNSPYRFPDKAHLSEQT